MSGAIPPLPQYALMAWCSVKAQGQLHLYLYETERHPVLSGKHYRKSMMYLILANLNIVM
jgi:hypothetical protein